MTTYRCAKHGITLQYDAAARKRKWTASPGRGSGATMCALLLTESPHAGRLQIMDPDTGRPTAAYCDVEEVGS